MKLGIRFWAWLFQKKKNKKKQNPNSSIGFGSKKSDP
jgi:hypothetical protein